MKQGFPLYLTLFHFNGEREYQPKGKTFLLGCHPVCTKIWLLLSTQTLNAFGFLDASSSASSTDFLQDWGLETASRHSMTLMCFCFSSSFFAFAVCSWSLSCIHNPSSFFWLKEVQCLHSLAPQWKLVTLQQQKQPQTIMLMSGWCSFVSSDHRTFSEVFQQSFRCLLANLRWALLNDMLEPEIWLCFRRSHTYFTQGHEN